MRLNFLLPSTLWVSLVTAAANEVRDQQNGELSRDSLDLVTPPVQATPNFNEKFQPAQKLYQRDDDIHTISWEADYRLDLLFLNLRRWVDTTRDEFHSKDFIAAEKDLSKQLEDANNLVYQVGESDMPKLPVKGAFVMKAFEMMRDNSNIISSMPDFDESNALRHELYQLRPLLMRFYDSIGSPNANIEGCDKWASSKIKRISDLKSAYHRYNFVSEAEKIFNDECATAAKELEALRKRTGCK